MTDPHAPLLIGFFSVVVKRDAVTRRYPGGLEAFDRVHGAARGNQDLSLLVRMSMMDVDLVFRQLDASGLVAGEDFGLIEMHQGVLIACDGIRGISQEREPFVTEWWAHLDPAYVAEPGDSSRQWAAIESAAEPSPVPQPEPAPPLERAAKSAKPPRRVSFGTGPVHYLYDEDDDED